MTLKSFLSRFTFRQILIVFVLSIVVSLLVAKIFQWKRSVRLKAQALPSTPEDTLRVEAPISAECQKTFVSELLELEFSYDSCVWSIVEKNEKKEPLFATWEAKNTKTDQKLFLQWLEREQGGERPSCYSVQEVTLLGESLIRVQVESDFLNPSPSHFTYISRRNDYARADQPGAHGRDKFEQYFAYLDRTAFPESTNMCWRETYAVLATTKKEPKQEKKAIVEYPTGVSQDFMHDADRLVKNIFKE